MNVSPTIVTNAVRSVPNTRKYEVVQARHAKQHHDGGRDTMRRYGSHCVMTIRKLFSMACLYNLILSSYRYCYTYTTWVRNTTNSCKYRTVWDERWQILNKHIYSSTSGKPLLVTSAHVSGILWARCIISAAFTFSTLYSQDESPRVADHSSSYIQYLKHVHIMALCSQIFQRVHTFAVQSEDPLYACTLVVCPQPSSPLYIFRNNNIIIYADILYPVF